ncbi:MAG: RNA polymerase sigma factor [Bacteroidales bacterium]|mgnify:CR=1 FL=1|nr:RNA polymerase sigma factor [Bacteroidales bacterium]MDD4671082.1 RNA polymerase sigma factor [Bacteroidales bacterium]
MNDGLDQSVERELILKCVRQERKAQRELYDTFSARFYPLCIRYVRDRDVAKDVLQDGFITIFDKIGTYKGDGSFEGWMRRIFINTALMYVRKNDVLKYSEDIDTTPIKEAEIGSSDIVASLDSKTIMRVITQMPDGFRAVFNLYVFEGYSHQEIAKELNITEGSSRSQLSRGRVWLQEKIKKL